MHLYRTQHKSAFTLIELLVVIAIISLLASFIIGVFGGVEESKLKTETAAVLQVVDSGINQYQGQFGHYPISSYTTDMGPAQTWDNKLAFYLCHKMQGTEIADAKALANTAKATSEASSSLADPIDSTHTYTADEFRGTDPDWPSSRQTIVINEIYEHIAQRAYDAELRKHTRGEFIDSNDIDARYIDGDRICDAYSENDGAGQAFIYVVLEAEPSKGSRPGGLSIENLPVICKRIQRQSITDNNADQIIDESDGDGTDIRSHGFPGFEGKFELWSAGMDHSFHATRGESVNDDNVSVSPYKHGDTEKAYE